jgi:hypothetical protein
MDNRRVAGAQRIVEQEIAGLIPLVAPCLGAEAGQRDRLPMFSGQADGVTLVSSFSLQQAWRGRPQVLQIFVIPGEEAGLRLVVNETPFAGVEAVGRMCRGSEPDPETGLRIAHFPAPAPSPASFVLADHLSAVRFQYLQLAKKAGEPSVWAPSWPHSEWPAGVRIVMVPLEPTPGRLQPVTATVPLFLFRNPRTKYEDVR